MQMVAAYSVFANGGYRVNPWIISKITDQMGNTIQQIQPLRLDESNRAIDARNAFVMESLLNEVTRAGTAARAQATLKRSDLYGKTGTTNDSVDTWFAGFQPTLAAVVWMGYDAPRSLGDRETGGGLSLPIWISFMESALKDVPVDTLAVPEGVIQVADHWYFEEFPPGLGANRGMRQEPTPVRAQAAAPAKSAQEAAPTEAAAPTSDAPQ
jgi:penicillin-binding protein 1A